MQPGVSAASPTLGFQNKPGAAANCRPDACFPPRLQTDSVCERRHRLRAGVLHHHANHRPAQPSGENGPRHRRGHHTRADISLRMQLHFLSLFTIIRHQTQHYSRVFCSGWMHSGFLGGVALGLDTSFISNSKTQTKQHVNTSFKLVLFKFD